MPFDALTVAAVKDELNKTIINGRIEKVYQPQQDLIVLDIFHPYPRRNLQLLLSVHPRFTRGHLITNKPENPVQPPAFCMLLRKYLQGGRILRIEQPAWERILKIAVENFHPDYGLTVYSLIFEAMGRFSNLILVDGNETILDAVKRFPQAAKGAREIFPGQKYLAPPVPARFNPATLDSTSLEMIIDRSPSDRPLRRILLEELMGLSNPLVLEVCARAKVEPEASAGSLHTGEIRAVFDVLKFFQELVVTGDFSPTILLNHSGQAVDVFSYRPAHLDAELLRPARGMNAALESTIHQQHEQEKLVTYQQKIRRVIREALQKARKKRDKQTAEYQRAEDADLYKLYGELLTVHQMEIKKGLSQVEVENYYDPGQKMVIPLDPAKSPNENAQQYFKRYSKAKKARVLAAEQLAKTEREVEYLESLENTLWDLLSPQELAEVEDELCEAGLWRKEKKKARPSTTASKPHVYTSSTGWKILIGRNNKQNDLLTMKMASPRDLWFHAQKIPGSHVVVRTQGKAVDEQTILEAASLAAFHSKARNSSKVPVDYTEKRYVRKPTGAKPGFVLYENFKTIIVDPDHDPAGTGPDRMQRE
ncbi:MAG TPA: NFACT family protein [Bacillota bacterium]